MTRRIKKVGGDEGVPLKLTVAERDPIVDRTFADRDLTDRLSAAVAVRSRITVYFTLSELEELQGHIAAEENHTKSRKIHRDLYKVYDRIRIIEETHADELSPEWMQKLAT